MGDDAREWGERRRRICARLLPLAGARRRAPNHPPLRGVFAVPKALKIVAAVMVALASATIGWFGVKWYQDSGGRGAEPISVTLTHRHRRRLRAPDV